MCLEKHCKILQLYNLFQETRRRQLAEAAENRAKLNESRGLANPERVQHKIEQARIREERLEKSTSNYGTPVLKVCIESRPMELNM